MGGSTASDPKGKKAIKIVVDRRENFSGIVEHLRKLGVEVEICQLPVADFIISGRIGIERKTVWDFLQSLIDGRLLTQAKLLAENFERPILILEGKDLYTTRDIHPNAIRGALAALTVDLGISIIPTEDEEDTARVLVAIAKRQISPPREQPTRPKRPAPTLEQLQRFIVEGLPNISAVLAKRLLSHFKTVEAVMTASEKELMKVPGIGKKRAKEIRRVLTAVYQPESPPQAP